MKQSKNEQFVVILISIFSLGLIFESVAMHWEFWVPILIFLGVDLLWVMHILDKPEYYFRELSYFIFTALMVFYHGVHVDALFDVSLVVVFSMVIFLQLKRINLIHALFAEYIVIMIIQMMLSLNSGWLLPDAADISRMLLRLIIVLCTYVSCIRGINDSGELENERGELMTRLDSYDADMEDFLTNISHELRTPVNVVRGMSDLLIKKNAGDEAYSVKEAGIRLAYQIEDIQDYTECKRKKLVLEEDDYTVVSLVNDMIASFRLDESSKGLELVVDLDPRIPVMLRGDSRKLHKIFRHLLKNAIKFTACGGIYVKLYTEARDYGANLCVEITDTGIGMTQRDIDLASKGMYQANKKRNRSTGGIGLGLFIVYGFVHCMGGFVKINSEKGEGTTVLLTIPQTVIDNTPSLSLAESFEGDILFHVRSDKYKVPRVRDFYRMMAVNLAAGIRVPLYPSESLEELERQCETLNVTCIFMGQEEYEENAEYFDELSRDVTVAVSVNDDFKIANKKSHIIVMPKPLYAYPIVKIVNEGNDAVYAASAEETMKPKFTGIKALIVDDEPMNLVVAEGLFKDYGMLTDTAESGKAAIAKFIAEDYDIVFMDHMMPEMDGVEAMKRIRSAASEMGRGVRIVALTANAISGAREMFMKEGFDGFIAKPVNIADFERVMIGLFS